MDSEVREILDREEGYRLDFKRKQIIDQDEDLARHLVAFANRHGGRIALGIRDDSHIEGCKIDPEQVSQKLRHIKRNRCSPPVRTEERYYEDQEQEGRVGDVFVIDISRYLTTPHSVTAGGNNAKRSFYIRSVDESRPIIDSEELNQLFTSRSDPSFTEKMAAWIMVDDYTYQLLAPSPRFYGWEYFEFGFFEDLSEEDREYLIDSDRGYNDDGEPVYAFRIHGDNSFINILTLEHFPAAVFKSLGNFHLERWVDQGITSDSEVEEFRRGVTQIDPRDIYYMNDPEITSELSVSHEDFWFPDVPEFSVPDGTIVRIKYPDEENYSRLRFTNDNLDIRIEFARTDRGDHPIVPPGHPATAGEDTKPRSRKYIIRMISNFQFPDKEDTKIRLHRTFADGLYSFLKDYWSWSEFVEGQPPRRLYEIGDQVENIESKLDELVDEE